MRSALILLAGLAGSALAHPTEVAVDRRTFGPAADILGAAAVDVGAIIDGVLGLDIHAHADLLVGLGAHGAAALEGGALGCKSGIIHADARAELKAWLATQTHITGALKTSLLGWCEGSVATLEADVLAALAVYIPGCADIAAKEHIYVTIDGIFAAAELEASLVLNASLQASLHAFLKVNADLDVNVKAGLQACAAGGLVTGLSADVKADLLAWLDGPKCSLSADLKVAIHAWINAKAGAGLVSIGSVSDSALSAISVGASVGASVEQSGALSASVQASIAAFLKAQVAVDLDVNVKAALEACARGKIASSLELDVRTDLAIWLASADCSLGVELKAVVLLWLSLAATAEVSVDLVSGLLVDITGFLTETVLAGLSINLRAALGLLAGGESLLSLSWETRAEIAAFLGGCTSIDIGVSIEVIIIQWFTGCKIPGGPAPSSSVPSLPSSTPLVPTVSVSQSVTGPAPTGPAPTGPAPSGPSVSVPGVPSVSAPSGPSGPAPSGPASSPSGPAPSGPAPSGTSPAESSPCEKCAGETAVPGGSDATNSVPVAPAPTNPPAASSGVPVLSTTTITRVHTVYACQ